MKIRQRTRLLVWALTLVVGAAVAAADDATAAPTTEVAKLSTVDAYTVTPGDTEVELFYKFGHIDEVFDTDGDLVDRPDASAHVLSVTVTHGIRERLDVTFAAIGLTLDWDESQIIDDEVGNILLNFKWRFLEKRNGRDALGLAWKSGFAAPVGPAAGDFEVTTLLPNFWSFDNALAFTVIEGRFNLSADFGIILPISSASAKRDTIFIADVGVGYQVTRLLQPVLELNYAYDVIQGPDANASILTTTVGLLFNVNDLLRIDIGLGWGVIGRNQDALRSAVVNGSFTF